MTRTEHDDERDTVWIKTEPSIDQASYLVTIEASPDRARVLTPTDALAYASTLLGAVARGEYDAAVLAQMRMLLGDGSDADQSIGLIIGDLRDDRPPLDDSATAPLRFDPGVNRDGEPFLGVWLEDQQLGQWTLPDARAHALAVLEAVTVADLDTGYYRTLTGLVNIEPERARTVVADLGKWRPGEGAA
jgi:hypothetical protein